MLVAILSSGVCSFVMSVCCASIVMRHSLSGFLGRVSPRSSPSAGDDNNLPGELAFFQKFKAESTRPVLRTMFKCIAELKGETTHSFVFDLYFT